MSEYAILAALGFWILIPIVFLIAWLVVSGLIAEAASRVGRNGFGWFLLSCLTTPMMAALLLFVLEYLKLSYEGQAKSQSKTGDGGRTW